MKTIKLAIAEPIRDSEVQPTIIRITESLPAELIRGGFSETEAATLYDGQAELLVEALFNSLPGGTFDRLVIKLLEKKVSLYRGLTDS